MNNRPRKRFRRKKNAQLKQQILRKEFARQKKYPLRTEYRQSALVKQNRKRGA